MIQDGALKGFVIINPRWASFTAEDYRVASGETYHERPIEDVMIRPRNGNPDLRGYEIARAEFFDPVSKISVSIAINGMRSGMDALQKLGSIPYVELLIHPQRYQLAVRTSKKEVRTSVKWATAANEKYHPKVIAGAAFMPTLFDLHEAEVLIPIEKIQKFSGDSGLSALGIAPKDISGFE